MGYNRILNKHNWLILAHYHTAMVTSSLVLSQQWSTDRKFPITSRAASHIQRMESQTETCNKCSRKYLPATVSCSSIRNINL